MKFEDGNQIGTKHGGEGALQRLKAGKPFLGIAAEAEKEVQIKLENDGIESLIVDTATKMQAIAELYYQACLKASQDGNIQAFDRYTARFGWLAGATLRAWQQVQKIKPKETNTVTTVLKAMESNHE